MPLPYSVEGRDADEIVPVDTARGFVLLVNHDIRRKVFKQTTLSLAAPRRKPLKVGMPIMFECFWETFKHFARRVTNKKVMKKTECGG